MVRLRDPLASSDLYREQDSVVNGILLTEFSVTWAWPGGIIFGPGSVILMTSVFQYC